MVIVKDPAAYQALRASQLAGSSIGFVPTMGALHKGHLSLVQRSQRENVQTVVSIFLNPTQFNDTNDFHQYPKHFEQDIELLETAGVDVLFFPDYQTVYPDNYRYKISETELSEQLCGASRPGHFDGVLTVVLRLLNLVKPDKAYFGEKDYQQYLLILGMAKAFFLETQILACPTIREADGLAFSSRNQRLSTEERRKAPVLYEVISSNADKEAMVATLVAQSFKVDYLEEINGRRYVAAYLGKVRLIDNVSI